jgi:hypothetical protein
MKPERLCTPWMAVIRPWLRGTPSCHHGRGPLGPDSWYQFELWQTAQVWVLSLYPVPAPCMVRPMWQLRQPSSANTGLRRATGTAS